MGVRVREKVEGSGEWWVFINHAGQRTSKKVGSHHAAKEAAKKIEREIALERFNLQEQQYRTATTFQEYAGKWLAGYVSTNLKPATYDCYKKGLQKHVFPVFGATIIGEITREAVKEFLYAKRGSGLSARSVELLGVTMGVIFNHAKEDRIVTYNPAERIGKVVKVEKGKRHVADFLNADEARIFLETVLKHYPWLYPTFTTAILTGMRRGELAALQWRDIDWQGRFLTVQRNEYQGKVQSTKSGKARRIDLSDSLVRILGEHRRKVAEEVLKKGSKMPEFVFTSEEGEFRSGNWVWEQFTKANKKSGLRRIRLHDLRHTFASLLIANGESLAYVRDQLGHADIGMTVNKYGHLVPGANRQAMNRLDEQIGLRISGKSAPQAHLEIKGVHNSL